MTSQSRGKFEFRMASAWIIILRFPFPLMHRRRPGSHLTHQPPTPPPRATVSSSLAATPLDQMRMFGATPAPTTTPFSSARLILTTSTGTRPPPSASAATTPTSARPPSTAIPLLTEIRRRVGLGGRGGGGGRGATLGGVHEGSVGSDERSTAACGDHRHPAAGASLPCQAQVARGATGGSMWTVSKRDVQRRRAAALASDLAVEGDGNPRAHPVAPVVRPSLQTAVDAAPPRPLLAVSVVGRGLLRRFNAACASGAALLSLRSRRHRAPPPSADRANGYGTVEDDSHGSGHAVVTPSSGWVILPIEAGAYIPLMAYPRGKPC